MLPLALDVARLAVAVVGRGAGARRRLDLLDAAGAARVVVFSDAPDAALAAAAGARLHRRLPRSADLAGRALVLVADLPPPLAAPLAAAAHAAGALVNVEDQTPLCDVHVPALVRRGDLVVAISTGGRSPGLARALKDWLEPLLDARWAARLRSVARRRRRWRADGRTPQEISALTRRLLAARGWLQASDSASRRRSGADRTNSQGALV
jgi:precorrin-2 dehydrogenase/sirohydrochlorin ferrochelatase